MKSFQTVILASIAILAFSACGPLARPSEELRYRLIVEVDTPEGIKRGSSVIEVRGVKNPDWVNIEGRGTRSSFRGEAVAVDLPNGRTLFALLKTEGGASDAADYPWLAFQDRLGSKDLLESIRMLRTWQGDSALMPRTEMTLPNGGTESAYPMLVIFKNIADPATVIRVDPDDLATSFGKGYHLKAILVQIADDNVTVDIKRRLPWWENYLDRNLDGSSAAAQTSPLDNLAGSLSARSFSTELSK